MSEVVIAAILPAISLAIYFVFAPIEFGASFLRQIPGVLNKPSHLHDALSPIWKISNVFLIFTLTGVAFFFSKATPIVYNFLLIPFICAMLAFLVRTTLYVYMFYSRDEKQNKFFDTIFTISNFAVPLFFGTVIAYLLSGKMEWFSLTSLVIYLLVILSTILGVSTFYLRYQSERSNKKLQAIADGAFLGYITTVGVLFPWVAKFEMQHIYNSKAIIALFIIVIFFAIAWFILRTKELQKYMWPVVNIAVVAVLIAILCAQWPWLVYASISFQQAFNGSAYVWHIVTGLAISLVLIAPGFVLLYKLMKEQPASKATSLKAAGLDRKDTKEG